MMLIYSLILLALCAFMAVVVTGAAMLAYVYELLSEVDFDENSRD